MMRENGPPAIRRRLAVLRALLVVALVVLLATVVVGPGRAIAWIVTDLIPVVLVIGIIFGVYGVAVRGLATLYDKYRHHW
jgi:predicted membrane protein